MLRIRSRQIESFSADARRRFRERIAAFMRREQARYIEDLSNEEADAFIDASIAEARAFGYETDRDISLFSMPCAVYGALSHRDPIFAPIYYAPLKWCSGRIRRTSDAIVDAFKAVLDAEFAEISGVDIVRNAGAIVFERGQAGRVQSAERLPKYFEKVFETRFRRLAEWQVRAHMERSAAAARRQGLRSQDAVLAYQQLAFLIGSDFGEDPLYPWAVKALASDGSQDDRLRRLEAAAYAFVTAADNRASAV